MKSIHHKTVVVVCTFILLLLLLRIQDFETLTMASHDQLISTDEDPGETLRLQVPADFVWGSATASYQVEGAVKEGGRQPSIWDVFSHTPGKIANNDTGDVADDQYHKYLTDIGLMQDMGLKYYRLSLSWSRIMTSNDGYTQVPNPQGIEFYNKFNEPLSFSYLGYGIGIHAPGRCTDRTRCPQGNEATEPYIVTHHVLISHAKAVALYRQKYQQTQKGKMGIALNCDWMEPGSDSEEDFSAAERKLEFQLSWFADPIWFGDYPESMKDRVKERLPTFTDAEKALLKGSHDFFALNHYTSQWARWEPIRYPIGWGTDAEAGSYQQNNVGQLIGPKADSGWLCVVPWGFRKMITWVHKRYNGTDIYITENGVDVPNESSLPLEQALNDTFRMDYYREYIKNMLLAINEDGARVRGYFAWSLLDNFEWADGYSKRFGLHYVDYKNDLKRYPKASAKWYGQVIRRATAMGYIPFAP